MLETLAKHAALDAQIRCQGDLHIDQHHTVEDTVSPWERHRPGAGRSQGDRARGLLLLPADEALARSVVDLSGRSYLHWNVDVDQGPRSAMDLSVLEASSSRGGPCRANVHIDLITGRDFHHGTEAVSSPSRGR